MSRIGNWNGFSFSGVERKAAIITAAVDGMAVSYVPEVARAMIKSVELLIGGQVIDTHTAEWLHAYDQLYVDQDRRPGKTVGLTRGVGHDVDSLEVVPVNVGKTTNLIRSSDSDQKFYVPLRFWFNNTCSQCLPLVALMYHDVEIKVKLRTQAEILTLNKAVTNHANPNSLGASGENRMLEDTNYAVKGHTRLGSSISPPAANIVPTKWWPQLIEITGAEVVSGADDDNVRYSFPEHGSALVDMRLLINYTFLDKVEREMFAKNVHHYIVDTITEVKPTWMQNQKVQVYDIGDINHPCKELIWCVRPKMNTSDTKPTQQTNGVFSGGAGQGMYKWDKVPHPYPGPEFWCTGGMVKDYFNFDGSSWVNGEFEAFETAKLVINGAERFEHDARFLREVVCRDKYAGVPETKIYRYPFCKNPQSWKPSGSLNFSRIDQARLELDLGAYAQRNSASENGIPDSDVFVFAKVHNIIKITGGMAGLMYQ